jgi:hypothetical protein
MSVKRNAIRYGVAAAALAILIIAGATYYIGSTVGSNQGTTSMITGTAIVSGATGSSGGTGSAQGPTSLLVIQLTDPPQVPAGTSSLNMTYSSLSLLVGEPTGSGNQMTTKTLTVVPTGGTATLDLLRLQNVSQTIGSATLPDGSALYSVTFTVTGIKIDVSESISSVSLATGNTFTVTLSGTQPLHGTNLALLRLDPVVVETPGGYSLIPSSVGVIRVSEGQGENQLGFRHQLTYNDNWYLNQAKGSDTANLLDLAVTGSTTTVEAQVNNTGTVPIELDAVELAGNFTVDGPTCPTPVTTTATTTITHTAIPMQGPLWCGQKNHIIGVIFVPVIPSSTTTTSSTTSNGCTDLTMQLVNDAFRPFHFGGLTLSPGECVNLTFTGIISFGGSSIVLIPSTLAGQSYQVGIVASRGGNIRLECTLPLGKGSCQPVPVFMWAK